MKLTPFNENKFADVTDRLHLYETEGIEPEVEKWAETQILISEVERRKELTDTDIRYSLILQFKKLDPARLTDPDKTKYAELVMKYGI